MASPVRAWDQRFYLAQETTFLTPIDPAAAQALEVHGVDMGVIQQPLVRPKADKTIGRGMTDGFVAGRYDPIPFSFATEVKSRATAATAMKESAIMQAAGFTETLGADAAYTLNSTVTPKSICARLVHGNSTQTFHAQQAMGGVIKTLNFSGGDTPLLMRVGGAFAKKLHLGQVTATVADGVTLSITPSTASHAYRLATGFYQWEDEIIEITAINYSTGACTIERGQLGSVAAAHTSAALYPYAPTPSLSGSPISNATTTVTIDSVATPCTRWSLDITTGMDHRPGESGSAYVQGAKVGRFDATLEVQYLLTDELMILAGKAAERKAIAVTIVQGSAAGGIFTFSLPYAELVSPSHPDGGDTIIATARFRLRDDGDSDMLSLTAS